MSREVPAVLGPQSTAAASAGTVYLYFPLPAPFMFEGYSWSYQTAEANTDNTLDFVIACDVTDADGTFDGASDTLFANANANGLLNTSAIGVSNVNKGNAAIAGGAAVAAVPTRARVATGTIRVSVVTAGTGTVPGINFALIGKFLQPLV